MDPDRDKLVKEILASALGIEDAAKRARFLGEACGAEPALRQEVERDFSYLNLERYCL